MDRKGYMVEEMGRKEEARKKSLFNRETVKESTICGCFFCMNVYLSEQVVDWCDKGQTAICPHCEIDSVIPGETDTNFLQELCEKYFTGIHGLTESEIEALK